MNFTLKFAASADDTIDPETIIRRVQCIVFEMMAAQLEAHDPNTGDFLGVVETCVDYELSVEEGS